MQILSSKGDIGVFRNSKQETTVPVVRHCASFGFSCHNIFVDVYLYLASTYAGF